MHVIKARRGTHIYIATKEGWRIASALGGLEPSFYHDTELARRLAAVRIHDDFDEVWAQRAQ